MDLEQENLQNLQLSQDIYKESYKLIFKLRIILTQIAFTLILPLYLIVFFTQVLSGALSRKISFNIFSLHALKLLKLSDLEWPDFALFFYFAFILAFSLLATSAVVYVVGSSYTSRKIMYKKVMSVVPNTSKRLMITYLSGFFAIFTYNVVFDLLSYLRDAATIPNSAIRTAASIAILILYVAALVHLSLVWQLAIVVSVLEDSCGIKAMIRSMRLMRGKMLLTIAVFLNLNSWVLFLFVAFMVFAFQPWATAGSLVLRALCFSLPLLMILMYGLVLHTIVYFVCKSYHCENIDVYAPLMAKEVQMEACDHV